MAAWTVVMKADLSGFQMADPLAVSWVEMRVVHWVVQWAVKSVA